MRNAHNESEDLVAPMGSQCGLPEQTLRGVNVRLINSDLWRQFHSVGTEMIITKLGRRMFPSLLLDVTGLEPDARYFVVMEISLSSNCRYKFVSTKWVPTGKADVELPHTSRLYIHSDSPATGLYWMSQPLALQKVKLTNNTLNQSGHILLSSMQKYIPYIHVIKASDILALYKSPTATFSFPETEFVAVTAYQNGTITKLKIDNNPFAKGFRDDGQSHTKRKSEFKESTGNVRKRSCSEQSCSSSVEDSGRSSLGSSSPITEDFINDQQSTGTPQEHKENRLIPHVNWENLATVNSNIPHLYSMYHRQSPMWRFPYLIPPPPLFLHHFLPFPYHPPLQHEPFYQAAEPYLMDLSLRTRDCPAVDRPS